MQVLLQFQAVFEEHKSVNIVIFRSHSKVELNIITLIDWLTESHTIK